MHPVGVTVVIASADTAPTYYAGIGDLHIPCHLFLTVFGKSCPVFISDKFRMSINKIHGRVSAVREERHTVECIGIAEIKNTGRLIIYRGGFEERPIIAAAVIPFVYIRGYRWCPLIPIIIQTIRFNTG